MVKFINAHPLTMSNTWIHLLLMGLQSTESDGRHFLLTYFCHAPLIGQ